MNTTTMISSDAVEFQVSGRIFGRKQEPRQKFVEELRPEFLTLVQSIQRDSALLKLPSDADKPAIWAAYGLDLALLKSYRDEFEACMEAAIACSAIAANTAKIAATYSMLKERVPALGKVPLLELSSIRAAKPAAEQLRELREEVGLGITRLLNLFGYWLQMLMEAELFGYAEWTAEDVCRYHYFRHELTEKVLEAKSHQTQVAAVGVYNKITEIDEQVIGQSLFSERHIHSVVDAKTWDFESYPRQVPKRVAEFLGKVPTWLRPLVRIVDGQMTMEEVVRLNLESRVIERTEISERYEYEPGVLLAGYVATGWNSKELEDKDLAFYQGQNKYQVLQAQKAEEEKKVKRGHLAISLLYAVVVIGVLWFFVSAYKKNSAAREVAQAAAYKNYFELHKGETRYVSELGNLLPLLQDGKAVLKFARSEGKLDSIHLEQVEGSELRRPLGYSGGPAPTAQVAWEMAPRSAYFDLTFENPVKGGYCGDVDLGPTFGLFAKLHILEMNSQKLVYTIEKYGEPK